MQVYFDADADAEKIIPYELLVETYAKEKKPEAGLVALDELYQAKQAAGKADPYLIFALAEQYRKAGKARRAEPLFRDVLKTAGDKKQYRAAVVAAQLSLFKLYLADKEADKNAENLLGVLGWVAGEAGGLTAMGDDLATLTKDKAQLAAIVKFAQAHQAELDYGPRLAGELVAMDAKDYKAAGELFDAAIDADPKKAADIVRTWGVSLLRGEQNAEAAKVFQRGLDERLTMPRRPRRHALLAGLCLELAGKTEEAMKVAREGEKLAPSDPGMQFRVAWIQYHAKQYPVAKKAYLDLVKKFEGDDKLREARCGPLAAPPGAADPFEHRRLRARLAHRGRVARTGPR